MFLLTVKVFGFVFLLWLLVTQIITPALTKCSLFPMFRSKRNEFETAIKEINSEIEDEELKLELIHKTEELKKIKSTKNQDKKVTKK